MSGYGDGNFGPNDTTTRAMLAMILWNLEGQPSAEGGASFNDVPANEWYASAVRWASAQGIISGYDDPSASGRVFDPNAPVTREQLAAMLYRYARMKGIDVSASGDLAVFTDGSSVSGYAQDAMAWARGAGLVNGSEDLNGNRVLEPGAASSRAVVATIFMRYCTDVAK